MKEAIVRKHALRLVQAEEEPAEPDSGPVVREVKGPGRFQIRKVTKADLRKAAEALSQQEKQDPFALYAEPLPEEFEDPLFIEPRPKPKVLMTKPAVKPSRLTKRET